jgi:hypothetical protein
MTPLHHLLPELERLLGEATFPHGKIGAWCEEGERTYSVCANDQGPDANSDLLFTEREGSHACILDVKGTDIQHARTRALALSLLLNAAPVLIEQARRGMNISDEPSLRQLVEGGT